MESAEMPQESAERPQPEKALIAGREVDYTPMDKERLVKLREKWSPGLGGRFLALSRGEKQALDSQHQVGLANLDVSDASADYQTLNKASQAERKVSDRTTADWELDFKEWIRKTKNPFFQKVFARGVVGEGKAFSDDQVDDQVEDVFTRVRSLFDENYGNIKIEEFISSVKESYSFDDLNKDFEYLAQFCRIFGDHSGTAIAHLVAAELGKENDDLLSQMKKGVNSLTEDEEELLGVVKTLEEEHDRVMEEEEKSQENEGGDEMGEEKDSRDPELSTQVEGRTLPDSGGGAVIGNRGKEYSHDLQGQDRLYYNLFNSGEVYIVADGAGLEGHRVASKLGPLLIEKLNSLENIETDALKQVVRDIHHQIQQQFRQESGATLDVLLKAGEKKYLIHVGEGFIGKVRTKEEIAALLKQSKEGKISAKGLKSGRIIEGLVEPQNFGYQGGKPLRTEKGFKTPEIGVDAEVDPVVIDISGREDIIILASDGFSDVLPFLDISTPTLVTYLEEHPQKTAEFLVKEANKYSREHFGEEADDIAVMVVKP